MTLKASRRPRILIADNDPANVQLLTDICEAEKFEVQVASDGQDTLTCIHDAPPDLVLLDVMMPRLDGFEVLEKLRCEPKTRLLPVILITAVSDDDSIRQGYRLGANDYITKPFKVAELVARMNSVIQAPAYQKMTQTTQRWDVGEGVELRQNLSDLLAGSAEAPLSLVLLRLVGSLVDEARSWRLARSLRLQVRGVDSAYLVQPDLVAILLIDTDRQGADAVARRLAQHAKDSVASTDPGRSIDVRWAVSTSSTEDRQADPLIRQGLAQLDADA
jgi:DNA-binding response OmpR family regulator